MREVNPIRQSKAQSTKLSLAHIKICVPDPDISCVTTRYNPHRYYRMPTVMHKHYSNYIEAPQVMAKHISWF